MEKEGRIGKVGKEKGENKKINLFRKAFLKELRRTVVLAGAVAGLAACAPEIVEVVVAGEQKPEVMTEEAEFVKKSTSSEARPIFSARILPLPEVIIHSKTIPDTTQEIVSDVGSETTPNFLEKLEEKSISIYHTWFVDQSLEFETDEENRVLTWEDVVDFNSQTQLIAIFADEVFSNQLPEAAGLAYRVGTDSNKKPVLIADCYDEKRNTLASIFPDESGYQVVFPPDDSEGKGGWMFYKKGSVQAFVSCFGGQKELVWENQEWRIVNQPEGHFFIWKVKPGDTLWEISRMNGIPLEYLYLVLERAEGHRDAKRLQVGTILIIELAPSRAPFVGLEIPEVLDRTGEPGMEALPINPVWTACYTDSACHWGGLNHDEAWMLAGKPKIIYVHRISFLGTQLSFLEKGDEVIFHKDKLSINKLKLKVVKTETVDVEKAGQLLAQAEDDLFAIVSCHSSEDSPNSQRLIVWLKPSG